jgi:CBS domain-containing protein
LTGIVTQTDITRGMVSLTPLQSVCDIMTKNVAAVPADATVSEAARVMASNGISCVVAMHRCDAAGILTEKDLLKRVVALHKNPDETHVADVMSFPITVIPPDYSVLSAGKKMETMHLHRLVIMDGKTVCGIVTQTDLMRAIHRELEGLDTERRTLRSELAELVRRLIQDPEHARELAAEWAKPSPAGRPSAETASVSADT